MERTDTELALDKREKGKQPYIPKWCKIKRDTKQEALSTEHEHRALSTGAKLRAWSTGTRH